MPTLALVVPDPMPSSSPRWRHALALLLCLAAMGRARAASFAELGTDTSTPIVFVHGWAMGRHAWDPLVRWFIADGYPAANLYRFSYDSLHDSNTTSAAALASFVAQVRARHGNRPVTLIAHSNGGLVARWYRVRLGGNNAVRHLITLGTPHAGTRSARYCQAPACVEMRPGSTFLRELGEQGCDISLWSPADEIILPPQSARCGTSEETAAVLHVQLLASRSVYAQLQKQL